MEKILFWNARGAGSESFRVTVKDLIKLNSVDILIICEPKVQFAKAEKFFLGLGFDGAIVSEADGYAGGIWVLWQKNNIKVELISSHAQVVFVKVSDRLVRPWGLAAIYASPINSCRSSLWELLDAVTNSLSLPWMFLGDFNELLDFKDKIGGSSNFRFGGMKDWVCRNGLIDLGYCGADFTWSNAAVKERLDRAFCNTDWRLRFPEAIIFHLARIRSDHCPILVNLSYELSSRKVKSPFRFQAMWLRHGNFSDLLAGFWKNDSADILGKEAALAVALTKWNKEVYGDIFRQKRRLLARISGIQRCLGKESNPFLVNLEKKLSADYCAVRDAENLFWKQKSRDRWLKEGDRNTRYFHLSTVIRRRRNKIVGLFNEEGIYHTELEMLKKIAAGFFCNLFTAQNADADCYVVPGLFPEVPSRDLDALYRPVQVKEIHTALFQIGRLKAPGHDGFPAIFFQDHWKTCSPDIIKVVSLAFENGLIPAGLNHTLITLVPKCTSPQAMHLFRPISLCCTVYKIISKIIVARLRPLLSTWVSPNQVSFVPGRHISDNVMIAQELLHKFKHTSGKKGFVAWKIDLSKAYDKLSWSFISQVLLELKIPDGLRKLIMHCVTSVSFQVLVNGELSDSFHGSRGVRQGDPISPYIFVLCMEKLSHIISHAVSAGVWKPLKATRFGPYISHLFFADDLILFAEASSCQAAVMKKVMDIFCSISGQAVNFEKSAIFCSANVPPNLANAISATCGSPLTADLGKYLGMPLLHSRVGKQTYAYLVDKVHSRLASWKCKVLNMAGRLTLIHSVNAAIPIYAMQTAKLPISVCDSLDKLNRDFLWGDSPDCRKIHAVNWATVCKPKFFGGLGIKRTRDMNRAMLAKVSWRLVQGDEGLWCQLFCRKYLSQSSLLQNYKLPASCSSTWSGIVHGAELLKKGLKWRIGDGSRVKFWEDHWSEFGRLGDFVAGRSDVDLSESVCAFWMNGEWDRGRLNHFLPEEVTDSICVIPFSRTPMDDRLIWSATSDGKFSVKTAYLLHFAEDGCVPYPWAQIWKLNIPPKLRIFLWSVVAGKLMTNHQRMCRKFTDDPSCLHCPGVPETLLHLLRDCPNAKSVWSAFNIPVGVLASFDLNWHGWLSSNLPLKKCVFGNIPWNIFFSCCCWHLWKWRCRYAFDSSFSIPYNAKQVIMNFVEEWLHASETSKVSPAGVEVMLSWFRPPAGYVKLNVDGSRDGQGGIGAGGVLRDAEGRWCRGFMVNLGTGEVLQAEAWGLCHGLQLALQHGVSKVICESDSAVLVNLVLDADIEVHPLGTIIRICRCLMQQFSSCSLSHVHRERNFVADGLAKASLSREKGIYFFENVPDCVSAAMEDDEKGMAKMRRVPAHCVQDYAGTDSDGCSRNGDMVDVELGVQGGQGCGLVGSAERGKWDGIGCAAAWGVMCSSKAAVAIGLSSERFCMDVVDAGREGNVMGGVEAECSTRAQAKVAVVDAILASQTMKEAGVVPGKGSRAEDYGAVAGPVACAASFP